MVLVVLLVLEPLLVRVDTPLAPLEQVLAEPLAVPANLAIGAVVVPPLRGAQWLHRGHKVIGGDHEGLVVDGLLHHLHLEPALLDLALGDGQVLPHHGLIDTPEPCSHSQVVRDAPHGGRHRLCPRRVGSILRRGAARALHGVLHLHLRELELRPADAHSVRADLGQQLLLPAERGVLVQRLLDAPGALVPHDDVHGGHAASLQASVDVTGVQGSHAARGHSRSGASSAESTSCVGCRVPRRQVHLGQRLHLELGTGAH
mmetsp:Transcript_92111/g.298208  ORF Transcript_92111/g.298208 Transcript_92111/m.298208 type:complete len:259 (-) Transcript_92111:388-1164(-)